MEIIYLSAFSTRCLKFLREFQKDKWSLISNHIDLIPVSLKKNLGGSSVANVLVCNVGSEFKLLLCYDVKFRTNTLG